MMNKNAPSIMQPHRAITLLLAMVLVTMIATFGFAETALAQYGGYNIDGNVPDAGATEFDDPEGNTSELGPVNASTTKVGVIHNDALPTLEFTDPTGKTDYRRVWMDTNVDSNDDVWLYFGWERDGNTGSGVIMFEFQQAGIPLGCNYSASAATLIANCNPFRERQPGDFIIAWDVQGQSIEIIRRVFTFTDNNPSNSQWDGPIAEPLQLSAGVVINSGDVLAKAAYGDNEFRGEAAINLTDSGIFPASPTECLTVGNVIPSTVTGNSDTADFKDIVLGDFGSVVNISSCGQVRITKKTVGTTLTGSFPYTLNRADNSAVEYGTSPALQKTGVLTGNNDSDLYIDIKAGANYNLTEGALASPWALSAITCNANNVNYTVYPANQLFKVLPSITTNCIITNVVQTGNLVVIKNLINDNGGTKAKTEFNFTVTGSFPVNNGQPQAFSASGITTFTVPVGAYSVTEAAAAGYTTTYSPNPCTNLQVTNNGTTTCTITNNDQPGTLIVEKIVVNDNGGTKVASDFSYQINSGTAVTFEGDGSNSQTVNAGTYDITEPAVSGYTTSYSNCDDVVVPNGGTQTCTITNNDNAPSLTLVKQVVNDNGGTQLASSWTLTATGPTGFAGAGPTVNNGASFDAGTYTLAESAGPAGYTAGNWSCTGGTQNGSQITLALGQSATCTIVNNDNAPSLTLVKQVVNDNGGTQLASSWTLTATGPTGFAGAGPTVNNGASFDAGTYTLAESTGPAGYTAGNWSCTGGSQNGSQITLALGQSATCTIVNNDNAPSLTLVKQVVNDNGGTQVASSWTLTATGPTGFAGAGPTVNNGASFDAGTYTLAESAGPAGYTAGNWNCTGGTQNGSQITLALGQSATCTIVNNDNAPSLTLVKQVVNDNGGTQVASSWTLTATGPTGFAGAGPTVNNGASFDAGTYTLAESAGPAGYTAGNWNCTGGTQNGSQITLALGQSATCTIINNDNAPSLTLVKQVVNDNGGTQVASSWTLTATGPTGFAGAGPTVNNGASFDAGTYTLAESTGPAGYTAGNWSCTGGTQNGSQVTLALGQSATCTIVNNDNAPSLTLVKQVVNDNGGTQVASSWTLTATGPTGFAGAGPTVNNGASFDAGTYTLAESTGPAGYTAGNWSCTGDGDQTGNQIALGLGDSATCTIVNNDNAPSLTLVKQVVNDNGGTQVASSWTLTATGPTGFAGAGPTVNNGASFDAGTYTLAESAGPAGYTAGNWSCTGDGNQTGNQIALGLGDSATCTIINNDDAPSLTLVKQVVNDNGGTQVASSWTLTATGPTGFAGAGPTVNNGASFDAGTYTLAESAGPAGYTAGSWSCTGDGDQTGNQIALGLGDSATCTIINNDNAPSLTLVKQVINNNGGSAEPSDWTLVATGPTGFSGEGPSVSSNAAFDAGTYSLSEIDGPDGYTASSWVCVGGNQDEDKISLALGESATCTITNNDQSSTLIVTKNTTIATDEEFSFEASSENGLLSGGSFELTNATSKQFTVNAGVYTVTEEVAAGWELVSSVCTDIVSVEPSSGISLTIGNGETRECVFTNDPLPQIQVTKTATTEVVIGTSGLVTFNVEVRNSGIETVTLTSLSDSEFGNLAGQGTCSLTPDVLLEPGEVYQCAFSGLVTGDEGNDHVNTVTAVGEDAEGNEAEDSDTETVAFDELPEIEVTKTANVTEVVGTSGQVNFTVVVENIGNVPVELTSLTDTDFGNLNGKGTCAIGGTIAVGDSYTCEFSGTVTGNESLPHNNTVTAVVEDEDGNEDEDEDTETVPFDELPEIEVTKTANVTEVVGTSGQVTFTVVVENISDVPVELISLTDTDFGDLNGQGTCAIGGTIAVGDSYTCEFSGTVTGSESLSHNNTVTAVVEDEDGNEDTDSDDETVPFDELPEIEVTKTANVTEVVGTSGQVTFTVVVENVGNVAVTLTELVDSDFGDLNGQGTCITGGTIAVGDTYTCEFSGTVTGTESAPHNNTVTATVEDEDGNEDEDEDTEEVPFDELPEIEVTKTANVTEVVGTSGQVTFTVVVENISDVPVELTSLTDTDFGDLNGQGTCAIGGTIAVGDSYTCQFSGTVTGSESLSHNNTVTAVVEDEDGNEDTDSDDETVPFDELPEIEVTKTANVTEVVGTSGQVTFTVVVENVGNVAVTLTELVDSDFGNLNGQGTCAIGGTIAVGDSYTCEFSGTVTGSESLPHNNTVTATVEDEDGNEDEDEDTEQVPFDELPDVEVTKTANVTEVVGTSGQVTFTIVVSNVGDVDVTLNSLTDTDFGNLSGQGTCVLGGTIAVGGAYTCEFPGIVTGSESTPHNNTVTVIVKDEAGNEGSDQDDETVLFDELPEVEVTKTANVTEVVGISGQVTFTVVVENVGNVAVTLTELVDTDFGDLNGQGTCATGGTIAVNGSYTCEFSGTVTGNESLPHNNTVTAVVEDEDGNEDEDEDTEEVPFDELPEIEVTKTANVTEVVGTSGQVTFTVVVENISEVPVELTSLTDTDFGNLNGQGTCAIGGTIAVGDSYTCEFSGTVTGSESLPHNNTVTAVVEDEDGNEDTDSDTETVPFDELPEIEVTKSANVTEVVGTSGPVTFTVVVENISQVAIELTSLTDTDFGDLNGQGTCAIGGTIAVGDSYTCQFSGTVTGNEATPHNNTVTATVEDEDGNEDSDSDDETVPFDELPEIEVTKTANVTEVVGTSGQVTFTVVVENVGNVAVTLTELVDSDFGDLNGQGTCAIGSTIAVGDNYTCEFSGTVTGSESLPHNNTVTATVEDEDGNEDEDEDTETVPFDELPEIEVTKTANVTEVVGTSGQVTFTVVVENISDVPVELISLTDTDFGDLNGQGTCAIGGTIAVGDSYTCEFSGTVTGSESLSHNNTVTAVVEDEDGNEDTDSDDETVPFDELPEIEVTKTANVTEVVGTSGQVTFTVVVENVGNVAVTLTELVDSDFGDLNGQGTCAIGGTIAVGGNYTCEFSGTVTGNESTPHNNTVTATVEDEDGHEDEDEDTEEVPFDELPEIEVTKSANVTEVVGTSGQVTFTVVVENVGNVAVTLTELVDSDFGDLNGQGTCAIGGTIAVGDSYTCAFSGTVTGSESLPHNNTVTAVVEDEDGNEDEDEDTEEVPFDELPQIEVTKTANVTEVVGTSGQVTFTVVVENISDVPVELTSLTDTDFGNLNGKGTCVTGGVIAVGDSYTCAFSGTVTGNESLPHNNTVTAVVEDKDGNQDSDEDDETVPFDELPQVQVTKSANPTAITGPSGLVTFTIIVQNVGNVPVLVDSLVDSDFGDLNGKGTCVTGGIIAVGGSYTCAFAETVTGSESLPHSNTVTVIVKDEDGNEDEDEDEEVVPFDELPEIEVTKTANPTSVIGTSGLVTFTITVQNIGDVVVTLTSLTDSDFGDLNGKGTCATGGVIPVSGSYSCEFTETVTGSQSTPHNNIATAVVEDADGNEDSDDDDATVIFEGTPQVEVTKTANTSVITGTSGVVTFTITVQNIGTIPVIMTSLVDSDFGDLNGKGTCITGGTIAVGGSYTCAFAETVTGSESLPHSNTVTVVVEDEDGNKDEDEDDEEVPFDELPEVEVTKSANVTQVVGTSGPVEFTIIVENIGNVDFTLTSLTDSDFGDLNGKGTCVTGGVIPVNGNYTCAFTETITGNEATPHNNVATAVVEDKDGNTDSDDDDETVPFEELANSLGNRVWLDNDRNGIQDPGENGVPGVKVDLYTAAGLFVATATTDENGEYLFTDLAAGSYYVEFTTPAGYVFTRYNANSNSQDELDSDAVAPFVTLGVTDDGAEAEFNENTTYSISYTNNDATRQATNVVITTTVPAGTTFVADASSPGWSCTSAKEGGLCTFTVPTMAPNSSGTLLFVVMLKEAVNFPQFLDLEVYLTHTSVARTQTVALAEGGINLTLDAGILSLVGIEQTPTPTDPTNLPGGEQPKQQLEMFLPSVSTEDAPAESSSVEPESAEEVEEAVEEEVDEEVQPDQSQSIFLPSVEAEE